MSGNALHSYLPVTGGLQSRNHRTERLEQYCKMLMDATQLSKNSSDFYEVLNCILDNMLKITQADASVMVLNGEDDVFPYVGGRNANGKSFEENDLRFVPALLDRVHGGQPIAVIYNVSQDPLLREDKATSTQYLKAVVVLPLMNGNMPLGYVQLGSFSALPPLEDIDLSMLKSLAAVLSLKTDGALAYSQVEQLKDSVEEEVKNRTGQMAEANNWLAKALEKAEKQLAGKRDAEQALFRFLNNMSHELRAPAQLILGHAHLALEDGTAPLNSQQHSSLSSILRACEHVGKLVTRLIDPGPYCETPFAIDPGPFDVRPVINETLAFCRGLTKNQPVQLSYYYPPELPNVLGDPTCIRQVLINLLANACRFTNQGKISVTAAVQSGYVVISVADTGTGIEAGRLTALLSMEAQSSAELAADGTGTGLGLPISKQLVELHGGQLWAQSIVGKGSVFCFSLPIVME